LDLLDSPVNKYFACHRLDLAGRPEKSALLANQESSAIPACKDSLVCKDPLAIRAFPAMTACQALTANRAKTDIVDWMVNF
jgi:hypothetical protein